MAFTGTVIQRYTWAGKRGSISFLKAVHCSMLNMRMFDQQSQVPVIHPKPLSSGCQLTLRLNRDQKKWLLSANDRSLRTYGGDRTQML